jgi:hypothetical protein
MKNLGRYILGSVIVICGTVLSAITKQPEFFMGSCALIAFLGFFAALAED